jgi:hypothetical protein
LLPLVLVVVLGIVAWKFHGASIPGASEVRSFIGR